MNENKRSILLVDDAPANIKILGEALKKDYQVRVATSGEKAVEIATSFNPPDLILLDIVMPGMNGYDVCRTLKANDRACNIPIIFLTAMGKVEEETFGLELGAVDYITKPFSLPIVKARVKTHIELKQYQDVLEDLSSRDGLTGIPNRRRFDEAYRIEWKRSCRNHFHLSLILIDIDFFKQYNDFYGHSQGDECLIKVAETLENAVRRPADLVARYGGEEFVSILPETDHQGALVVAGLLQAAVNDLNVPHEDSKVSASLTISLGVASMIPNHDATPNVLIDNADKCLYQAKEKGRNRLESLDLNP